VEAVKLRLTFSCVWLVAAVIATSAQPAPKFVKFDRLCGELSFVTPVSGGGMDSEPLNHAKLELYPWEEGIACCRKSQPFFKTMTGEEGAFEFKNVDPGRYWFVVPYRGRTYQMAIMFDPKRRTPASAACWQQLFHIDAKGHFTTGVRAEA
jgi:hypothetical protein